jgi:hypothetical protein
MKKTVQTLYIMLSLAIAGCDSQSVARQPGDPPVSAPPPSPPQSVDCSTQSFTRTTDVDALPGGIWTGELIDCADNTQSEYVKAMITEDGRFHIVAGGGRLLTGTLGTTGNLLDGHGVEYGAHGTEFFSGPTTGLFVQGSVLERQTLEGRWGTEWGSYGHFSFDYSRQTYERVTPLADLAGVWSGFSVHRREDVEGVWTVENDGRLAGQDEAGCLYSGQFSLIDERFNIVAVDISLAGCEGAGTYSGLAYREDLQEWYEKAIEVSVDDGKQALRIHLLIERP